MLELISLGLSILSAVGCGYVLLRKPIVEIRTETIKIVEVPVTEVIKVVPVKPEESLAPGRQRTFSNSRPAIPSKEERRNEIISKSGTEMKSSSSPSWLYTWGHRG